MINMMSTTVNQTNIFIITLQYRNRVKKDGVSVDSNTCHYILYNYTVFMVSNFSLISFVSSLLRRK